MSLNIKNEHVHELVRTAAVRTGLSQTSVVERALAELLARLDAEDDHRRARIDAILADVDRSLVGVDTGFSSDDLYDADGLPA